MSTTNNPTHAHQGDATVRTATTHALPGPASRRLPRDRAAAAPLRRALSQTHCGTATDRTTTQGQGTQQSR